MPRSTTAAPKTRQSKARIVPGSVSRSRSAGLRAKSKPTKQVSVNSAAPGENARPVLLRAALDLFGAHGFDGTSIREIAKAAGTNVAGIAYHFGGKRGLHTACAEHVVQTVGGLLSSKLPSVHDLAGKGADDASEQLVAAMRAMLGFLVASPDSEAIARFAIREQMFPSPAFDILYEQLFQPMHARVCGLWAIISGTDPDSAETRLRVFSLFGQIIYFRLGRHVVFRNMKWDDKGKESYVEDISRVVEENLRGAIMEARCRV